ncbi:hypothetical protein ACIPX0_05395 [Streptomyces sp. NPDC090075]|uniref:hypothetical protein n=1 Tax=Streptomyces sp. NPDC090075 TaxID=3365937 RepID=UPI0038112DFC
MRQRAAVAAVFVRHIALYALAELVRAVRGTPSQRLERHAGRLHARLHDALHPCYQARDYAFTDRVEDLAAGAARAVIRVADACAAARGVLLATRRPRRGGGA